MHEGHDICWVGASYTAVHHVRTNPVYAGAYAYGKTRTETVLDAAGGRHKRIRHLPRSEWQVLCWTIILGSLTGGPLRPISASYADTRPGPHKEDGAVREGVPCAGARPLRALRAPASNTLPRSFVGAWLPLPRQVIVEGRGVDCLHVGGVQIV